MNLVLIGSFGAASRKDSRATASVTPSTSKRTLAGRITATQDSKGPFPLPIRVSSGFLVKDFCGKIRIHILPCRFMLRAMATRAASICLVSSQQRCRAMRPYSPNATVGPRLAMPALLPRCMWRYLTLSGINGIRWKSYKSYMVTWLQSYMLAMSRRNRLEGWQGLGLRLLGLGFSFADPAFDAEFAIDSVGFGETIFDSGPQRVKRNTAPMVLLHAGQ